MKLVSFDDGKGTLVGVMVNESEIAPIEGVTSMLELIALGRQGLEMAQRSAGDAAKTVSLDEVHLLAPIPQPRRNIMCLGKNYAAHAEESNLAWGDKVELPQYPMIFTKATTAANGPFDQIPYDATLSTMIDFEAELAVIVGRDGRGLTAETASEHIFGYCVLNDVTARDLQRQHQQFFIGKSLDGSAPFGPWIVTRDEIADPQDLRITCSVNGELKQDSNTKHMIFDIVETLVQLSRGLTLLAGDIIATGTPSGVGFARTPPEFLQPGDEVTCTVEGVGTIRNRIAG